jgi:ubiquinone/menaquinone biosynthesis C-methylase UbiE
MADDKVRCSEVARRFERDYWDGERRYGYGGYSYDGRWSVVAKQLVETYSLMPNARILDVGCGRGFLLYEFTRILSKCTVAGFDVSTYGLKTAKEEIRQQLFRHDARVRFPFEDRAFDLAISINALHNLPPEDAARAFGEMERVAANKYLVVESFRTPEELFNLQCWALTCESFLRPESWNWLFDLAGYAGDFEFIFFEAPASAG